jgi:hypothetical protein
MSIRIRADFRNNSGIARMSESTPLRAVARLRCLLLQVPLAAAGSEEMASVPGVESAARNGGGVAPAAPTARASQLAHLRHHPRRLLLRVALAAAGAEEMARVPVVESAARNGGGVAPAAPTARASLLLRPRLRLLRLAPAVAGTKEMAHVPMVQSAARNGGGVAPAAPTADACVDND